ncbi:MAG: FAD-dependent oxidoreductase [Chlamydiales bacterium]|nr:FAD-dependent oxidoreductase [Chlamydiales bacterium]
MVRIAILGGGISGLSLAYYLKKRANVTVFEKERPGGMIGTRSGGRFFFEMGPRTFSSSRCNELLKLIEELNLSDDLIYAKPQKRYLYYKGKLRSVQGMALRGLLRGGFQDFYAKPEKGEKTVHAFAAERFGNWVADHIFDAVTLGIYANSSKELSLDACFPSLVNIEGSLILKALKSTQGSLFTLEKGMHQLVDALKEQCKIVEKNVTSLNLDADLIYSTLPAYEMEQLTGDARFLQVRYSGITTVQLGYAHDVLKQKGFGYLVPSCYGLDVMGVVFDSCVFPQQNQQDGQTRLTVMLKAMDENQAIERALKAVKEHLDIHEWPLEVHTHRYEKAIPQMGLGHQRLIETLKRDHPNIVLAGSYVSGPAVNACIKQARELAEQFANASSERLCALR